MYVLQGLRLLFGLQAPVGRLVYALTGFALLALKFAGDWLISLAATDRIDPIQYFNPILTQRLQSMGTYPDWLPWVMFAWALPFIWIGVSMTARRSVDAGYSAWFALMFFTPVINNLVMLCFCLAPTKEQTSPYGTDLAPTAVTLRIAVLSLAGSSAFGLLATLLVVFGAQEYGSALFVAAPFLIGVIAAVLLNRKGRQPFSHTILVAFLSVTLCGGMLVVFALEGLLCLAMAGVIAYPLAALGALLGWAMSSAPRPERPTFGMILFWPALVFWPLDNQDPYPLHEVTSKIEVDAAPEQVWPNVIGFTELPPPDEWLMQIGVACPLRARIEGEGVGAIRYCEFTTGPFIEPIRVWEPPYRLGFDVVAQPPSMREWSPYEIVHAPHLVGTMQSERGEFRLTRLPGNRTLLEGTTWYRLKMNPEPYWTWYSDRVVHVIHDRVLRHVRTLSEVK